MTNHAPITELSQFAELTVNWFTNKSQQLDALINFPEHEDIKIQDNIKGEERVLTPVEREAFIDGLKVAATIFNRLPFDCLPVDAEGNPMTQPEPEAAPEPAGEPN